MTEQSPGELGTQQDVILARVGAFIVDHVVSVILGIALGVAAAVTFQSLGMTYVGAFLGLFGYFIVLEGLFGQTLGKRLFGIVVVSSDGSPITFGQSLVRNLLRIVDGILNYAVALVVMLTNQDRKRVGDFAANTVVVRARRDGPPTGEYQHPRR